MITKEQYLEAKKIVDEYELNEFEEGQRKADQELDDDYEEEYNDDCDFCGQKEYRHAKGCIHNDPLAYNEVGYD